MNLTMVECKVCVSKSTAIKLFIYESNHVGI